MTPTLLSSRRLRSLGSDIVRGVTWSPLPPPPPPPPPPPGGGGGGARGGGGVAIPRFKDARRAQSSEDSLPEGEGQGEGKAAATSASDRGHSGRSAPARPDLRKPTRLGIHCA